MSWEYSENILVQNSAGKVLKDKLGWEVEFAYNTEVLGESGTLGRKSYKEIVLTRYLRRALFDNNNWMTDEYADSAVKTLCAYTASATLMQINEEKYSMLRDGIPVQVKKSDGTFESRNAAVFNFAEPTKNHFLAVQELKIHGELYRRRTDIVGFVNGIPLLFVELKKQNVDVKNAYECNYTDYLSTIPQLFHFNAFLMLSNGLEAKVGTMGSKYEFFHEWKRLKEDEAGAVDLETMLLGICNKQNFMDLFENFILFDHSGGKCAKIFARNHQYLGVNEAVESYKARKLKNGKLGVFWHTQGSGKSYSMVFLAQKIRRQFTGSPTFVILSDRDELNKQISDTFENCGLLEEIIGLNTWNTSNVNDMYEMFYRCSSLKELDLSSFDTRNVLSAVRMFAQDLSVTTRPCKLTKIYVGDNWDMSNIPETDINTDYENSSREMFARCTSLVGGAGTAFDSTKTDKEYAIVDGKGGKPGYLTHISAKPADPEQN